MPIIKGDISKSKTHLQNPILEYVTWFFCVRQIPYLSKSRLGTQHINYKKYLNRRFLGSFCVLRDAETNNKDDIINITQFFYRELYQTKIEAPGESKSHLKS